MSMRFDVALMISSEDVTNLEQTSLQSNEEILTSNQVNYVIKIVFSLSSFLPVLIPFSNITRFNFTNFVKFETSSTKLLDN